MLQRTGGIQEVAIKCIALDLDRTTLNVDGHISIGNKKALEEAIKKGIHVIIASGRAFDSLPKDVLAIPGIEYAITSNGAAMYQVEGKKCLYRSFLPEKAVLDIFACTKDEPVTYEVFIDGVAYGAVEYIEDPEKFGATKAAVEYVKRTRRPVEDIKSFALEHISELDCMDIIVAGDEVKERLQVYITNNIEGVYVTSSIKQLLEISNKEAGKHSGVRFFMDKLGLQADEIAAFGDADNDVDMLSFVGHGVAVSNASEKCKAAAKYITLDYKEDAIAYALKELLKINE